MFPSSRLKGHFLKCNSTSILLHGICFLKTQVPEKTCEDCGGSGICSECKGEGFVLKRLSEDSAERARLTAKNMATRYTAGYSIVQKAFIQTYMSLHKSSPTVSFMLEILTTK